MKKETGGRIFTLLAIIGFITYETIKSKSIRTSLLFISVAFTIRAYHLLFIDKNKEDD